MHDCSSYQSIWDLGVKVECARFHCSYISELTQAICSSLRHHVTSKSRVVWHKLHIFRNLSLPSNTWQQNLLQIFHLIGDKLLLNIFDRLRWQNLWSNSCGFSKTLCFNLYILCELTDAKHASYILKRWLLVMYSVWKRHDVIDVNVMWCIAK